MDDDPWVTILRNRPLMEDPHYEDDAQFWHVITTEEFDQEEQDAESTEPLRCPQHTVVCLYVLLQSTAVPSCGADINSSFTYIRYLVVVEASGGGRGGSATSPP